MSPDVVAAACPYCGEPVELLLDPAGAGSPEQGGGQEYVEDCPVCCRPWTVSVRWRPGGHPDVRLRTEDDA